MFKNDKMRQMNMQIAHNKMFMIGMYKHTRQTTNENLILHERTINTMPYSRVRIQEGTEDS